MLQEPTDPVPSLACGGGFAPDLGFISASCRIVVLSGHSAERSHSLVCGTLSTTLGKHFKENKITKHPNFVCKHDVEVPVL